MLAIARILKSYGTDGGLLVSSDVDLETLEKGEPVYIVYDGLEVPFFISACTPKGNRYILHLTDICSLEDADEVVGRDILADVSEEPDGPDFIGWTVYDAAGDAGVAGAAGSCGAADPAVGGPRGAAAPCEPRVAAARCAADPRGRCLGVVTDDAPIPGNYCLYVGELMIPLHEDFIVSVDPERRELVLNLPAGLY
jgi:ribosomal 30S subunit maturation factor RimM